MQIEDLWSISFMLIRKAAFPIFLWKLNYSYGDIINAFSKVLKLTRSPCSSFYYMST